MRIGRGSATTREFWSHVLGWPVGEPWGEHPEFTSFIPPSGDEYVHVQEVDDAARVVHVDIGAADVDAETERVIALGARRVESAHPWIVLADPAGLPFCVTPQPPG